MTKNKLNVDLASNKPYFYSYGIDIDNIKDHSIFNWDLSVRTENCLKRKNIRTLKKLLGCSPDELLDIRNFGNTCLKEVEKHIERISRKNSEAGLSNSIESHEILTNDYESVPYYKRYNLGLDKIVDENIMNWELSVRTENCLSKEGIHYLKQLLNCSPSELLKITNFGSKSLKEIEKLIEQYIKNNYVSATTSKNYEIPKRMLPYIIEIILGDLSFLDKIEISENEEMFVERYEKEIEVISEDLRIDVYEDKPGAIDIINMLNNFVNTIDDSKIKLESIKTELSNIDPEYLKRPIINFINNYGNQDLLAAIKDEYYFTKLENIRTYTSIINNNVEIDSIIKFLKWVSQDINAEFSNFVNNLKSNREKIILISRACGETLEVTGDKLGVTRERIRQIEKRIFFDSKRLFRKLKIINKLSALLGAEKFFSLDDTKYFISPYWAEFKYLVLKYIDDLEEVQYFKEIDAIVNCKSDDIKIVKNLINSLPTYFKTNQTAQILHDLTDNELHKELISKFLSIRIKKSGEYYFIKNLSLTDMYRVIFESHFKDGIRVYDDDEIDVFKEKIINEFGDVDLPDNNRSISIRLTEIGVLCDRGKYKIVDELQIDQELVDKIQTFIYNSKRDVLLTSSIYEVFRNQLMEQGIDNHYYLHGILREKFMDRFYFKKDCVMKNKTDTSISNEIEKYIMKFDYPITISQIKEEFPGATQAIINRSIVLSESVNLFGRYIHLSNIDLDNEEKTFLREIIEEIVSDNQLHHAEDLYYRVEKIRPDLWKRVFVEYPFSAFSLAEILFSSRFQFARPFFSNFGVKTGNKFELLQRVMKENTTVSLKELRKVVKTYNLQFQNVKSILDFSLNTHYLTKKYKLISEDNITLTQTDISKVESLFRSYLVEKGTSLIRLLPYVDDLPTIDYDWDEWLLYSLIYKHSETFEVSLSSKNYDQAYPIIAFKGELDHKKFMDIQLDESDTTFIDFSNIDELIDDLDSLVETDF